MGFIKSLAKKIGMDGAIAYSSGSKVIGGAAGVLSIFFISTFLSGVEQGFYYTFGSILALQVFFELGLTGIMTQYVAHEASHLRLNEIYEYEGELYYLSRLSSLVHFCVKWYSLLGVIVLTFLVVVGFTFFANYSDNTEEVIWKTPWILICIGTAVKLFQSPLTSIITGLGFVKEMSEIGFWQQVIIPAFTWIGLACGLKLYVVGIGYLLSVIVWVFYVYNKRLYNVLYNLWKTKITERVSYIKEIFPYQWKIALSWVSGYFIFQLFNPILFAIEGAVVAGQMGMTLQVLNAIQSFSLSWLNTKIPLYSKLIALKDYFSLDKLFNITLKQMTSICLALLVITVLCIMLLQVTQLQLGGNILAERFLPTIPLLLLVIPVYLQQFTNSWATYLRCHKKEPFLVVSVCSGIAHGLAILILGNYFGLYGMTIGYCVISIILFPWGYIIYLKKKREWHS